MSHLYQRFHGDYYFLSYFSRVTVTTFSIDPPNVANTHTGKRKKNFKSDLHIKMFLYPSMDNYYATPNFIIIVIITKRHTSLFLRIIFTTLRWEIKVGCFCLGSKLPNWFFVSFMKLLRHIHPPKGIIILPKSQERKKKVILALLPIFLYFVISRIRKIQTKLILTRGNLIKILSIIPWSHFNHVFVCIYSNVQRFEIEQIQYSDAKSVR